MKVNRRRNITLTVRLTEEEKAEQAVLRREYIDSFKRSLEAQLDNTTIVYPDGTRKKVQKQ